MTRTATAGLLSAGGFVVLLLVTSAAFVDLDRDGIRGIIVGVGLGLVNLGLGYLATRWALRHGQKSAMATVAGGFLARLLVVAGLMVVFQRTGAADPAAFALSFLVFFFVYLGVELLLVERSLAGSRKTVERTA